jgi:beta-glucanase (GH16 family)
MKTLILFLILIYQNGFSKSFKSTEFLPPAPDGFVWKEFFSEDFIGEKLNDQVWKPSYENGVRRDGWWRKDAAFVDGKGNLVIKTFKDGKNYISGAIETKPEIEFRYGYYIAKVKTQTQKGQWSAFWLWPFDPKKPGAVEIDIFEYGFFPGMAQNAIHHYQQRHQSNTKRFSYPDKNEWHTFAAWWTPKEITFFKDGKVTWKKASNPSDTPSMIMFSTEIGNAAAGNIKRAKLPDKWLVDWVRVYNLEPSKTEFTPPLIAK